MTSATTLFKDLLNVNNLIQDAFLDKDSSHEPEAVESTKQETVGIAETKAGLGRLLTDRPNFGGKGMIANCFR